LLPTWSPVTPVTKIVPCDPSWSTTFEAEEAALREVLGDLAGSIQHVGFTAVPGLAAKAVIDMQISVHFLHPMYRTRSDRFIVAALVTNTQLRQF
jgi:GrpB-like predicted nucleotidyltransferase (UPF0157 family)